MSPILETELELPSGEDLSVRDIPVGVAAVSRRTVTTTVRHEGRQIVRVSDERRSELIEIGTFQVRKSVGMMGSGIRKGEG
jgi:hypothetical protein